MIFLNSIKILFNNLSVAFKSLVYKIIALLVSGATVFAIAFKPLQILARNGFFTELWNGFSKFTFNGFFTCILNVEEIIISTFKASSSWVLLSLIFAIFIGYFLMMTLGNFDKIPLCEVLGAKMSSNCKIGFTGAFFSRLWYSIKYTLSSFLIFLPFDLAFVVAVFYCIRLFTLSGLWLTIAPFVVILVIVLFFALRLTLYSNWAPACCLNGKGVFNCFAYSCKILSKRFFKTLANSVLIVITVFFFNILMIMLTAGVGLIVTIPASILLVNSFNMVNFYVCTGNRFYVDPQTVVSPKKLETQEKVENLINLV